MRWLQKKLYFVVKSFLTIKKNKLIIGGLPGML